MTEKDLEPEPTPQRYPMINFENLNPTYQDLLGHAPSPFAQEVSIAVAVRAGGITRGPRVIPLFFYIFIMVKSFSSSPAAHGLRVSPLLIMS